MLHAQRFAVGDRLAEVAFAVVPEGSVWMSDLTAAGPVVLFHLHNGGAEAQLRAFQALHEGFRAHGVRLVGLGTAMGPELQTLRAAVGARDVILLADPTAQVAASLGWFEAPTTRAVVIDAQAIVRETTDGPPGEQALAALHAVERLWPATSLIPA